MNEDGRVDMLDFVLFAEKWQFTGSCPQDFSCDGIVNVDDLLLLLENWLWGADRRIADMNEDGCVDMLDFVLFAEKWQFMGSCPQDFNVDGVVDCDDLLFMASDWLWKK